MKIELATYFLMFLFYSFFGWIMEIIATFVSTKKIVNRGFLIGPICPIYGYGSLFIYFLLKKYLNDPLVLFVMATLICSLLEYFTSYIMEKIFKARWWDYSNKKYNINGRVCLENLLAFGALGLAMMYYINPFFLKIINLINQKVLIITSLILLIIYLIDNIISFKVINSLKSSIRIIKKDSTEEITKKVREILSKKGFLYKRLVSAFQFVINEKFIKDFREKIKKKKDKE